MGYDFNVSFISKPLQSGLDLSRVYNTQVPIWDLYSVVKVYGILFRVRSMPVQLEMSPGVHSNFWGHFLEFLDLGDLPSIVWIPGGNAFWFSGQKDGLYLLFSLRSYSMLNNGKITAEKNSPHLPVITSF